MLVSGGSRPLELLEVSQCGRVVAVRSHVQLRSGSTFGWTGRCALARRSVRPRSPAVPLGLGAPTFPFDPSTPRATRGPGRSPDGSRNEGLAQEGGKALSRRSAIASLRTVLRGADGEHRARESPGEAVEDEFALGVAQRRRRAQVEGELHPRVGGVDALAAGSRGMGELLDQLSRRHPEAAGCAGARRHVQVVHPMIVSHLRRGRRSQDRPEVNRAWSLAPRTEDLRP